MESTVGVDESVSEGVVVLALRGAGVSRPDLVAFRQRAADLLARGVTRVVLDLSRETWLGAACLGEIVRIQRTLRSAGGDLRLASVPRKMVRILKATALDRQLPTFGSVPGATRSFHRERAAHAA